jgi:hypothetical protein
MRRIFVAASILAVGMLCLEPSSAGSQAQAASSNEHYDAHAPSNKGAKPVSGGKHHKCYRKRGLAGAVGLPNCDNPNKNLHSNGGVR